MLPICIIIIHTAIEHDFWKYVKKERTPNRKYDIDIVFDKN